MKPNELRKLRQKAQRVASLNSAHDSDDAVDVARAFLEQPATLYDDSCIAAAMKTVMNEPEMYSKNSSGQMANDQHDVWYHAACELLAHYGIPRLKEQTATLRHAIEFCAGQLRHLFAVGRLSPHNAGIVSYEISRLERVLDANPKWDPAHPTTIDSNSPPTVEEVQIATQGLFRTYGEPGKVALEYYGSLITTIKTRHQLDALVAGLDL